MGRKLNEDKQISASAAQIPTGLPDWALVDIKVVCAVTGRKSPSSIYSMIGGAGGFPEPVRLSKRCTRWKWGAVREWVEAQVSN